MTAMRTTGMFGSGMPAVAWMVVGAIIGGAVASMVPVDNTAAAATSEARIRGPASPARRALQPAPDAPLPPAIAQGPDPIAQERADAIRVWGVPPSAPSNAPHRSDVEAWLAETGLDAEVIDCTVYPCVAAFFAPEEDPDLKEDIRDAFPHARVMTSSMHFRESVQWKTEVAFLGADVDGLQWRFVYRLMRAVSARAEAERFQDLKQTREVEAGE